MFYAHDNTSLFVPRLHFFCWFLSIGSCPTLSHLETSKLSSSSLIFFCDRPFIFYSKFIPVIHNTSITSFSTSNGPPDRTRRYHIGREETLKAKYYPRGELVGTAFPSDVSPTWRAIEHGLALLKKGLIWRIGTGSKICNMERQLDPEAAVPKG
jgi:hypothetical protein